MVGDDGGGNLVVASSRTVGRFSLYSYRVGRISVPSASFDVKGTKEDFAFSFLHLSSSPCCVEYKEKKREDA